MSFSTRKAVSAVTLATILCAMQFFPSGFAVNNLNYASATSPGAFSCSISSQYAHRSYRTASIRGHGDTFCTPESAVNYVEVSSNLYIGSSLMARGNITTGVKAAESTVDYFACVNATWTVSTRHYLQGPGLFTEFPSSSVNVVSNC